MGAKIGLGLGILAGALAATASPAATPASDPAVRPAVQDYAQPIAYPSADEAAVAKHFNEARRIAGNDLYTFFNTLCIQDQLYKERTSAAQYLGTIPPQKVFDNLYYVGQMMVGAWALTTDKGIILFDGLNNEEEARDIIVPGLRQMGLDPHDIRYVVITHSHGDHYGGAEYFRRTYGSALVASQVDWDVMARPSPMDKVRLFDHAPQRGPKDIALADGQTLTLGGETVHFAVTPGHTPGTLSSYFAVRDKGVPHIVGFYGGVGMPRAVEAQQQQIASMTRWMSITRAARVDAQIGNHPLHFDGPARLEVLKYRQPGQTNPFVIGPSAYQRYIGLQRECVKLELAREGKPTE